MGIWVDKDLDQFSYHDLTDLARTSDNDGYGIYSTRSNCYFCPCNKHGRTKLLILTD